jgi:hypothetical protein
MITATAAAVAICAALLAAATGASASAIQWRPVADGLGNPGGGVYLTNSHSGYYMGRINRREMFGVHDYRGSRGFGARVTDDGRVYRWGYAMGDANECLWIGPAGNGPPGDSYLGRVDGENRDAKCSSTHMRALSIRTNFGRDFNCPANAAVGPQRTTLRRSAAFFHNVKWERDGDRYSVAHAAGPRRAVLPRGTTVWYRYTTRDGAKAVVFARDAASGELGWGFVDADAVERPDMRHWTLAGSWGQEWTCGTALDAGGRHWRDTIGVARGASVYLSDDNSNTDRTLTLFESLVSGGTAVAGDFDGDGDDEVGVYNAPYFRVPIGDGDEGGPSTAFSTVVFGQTGDLPLTGDWDGDGVDTAGVFRNGVFMMTDTAAGASGTVAHAVTHRQFALGLPGDVPLAGRWTSDQDADAPAVYRAPEFYFALPAGDQPASYAIAPGVVRYGNVGDLPVAGDWDNKGHDSFGVFREGTFLLRNANTPGPPDSVLPFGAIGDTPLAGNWDSN